MNTSGQTPARPSRTPAQIRHAPAVIQRDDYWANDILGLGRAKMTSRALTLETEFDAYLLDSHEGTDSITYWQVCCTSI